jgi:hypothetical protein
LIKIMAGRRALLREINAIWDAVEVFERRHGFIPELSDELAEIRRGCVRRLAT